jgi:hypothetical protein
LATDHRVGLFRALLVAHGQGMVNRTRKALGRRGAIGLVVVVLILGGMASPLLVASGLLGHLFGRAFDEPLVAVLMGSVLTGATVGFGIIGGLLGSARQLTWDAYRSFPVPFRTLFFAETFASLGDLVVLGFMGLTTAMGGAFVWEAPSTAPAVLFLMGQLVLWVLFTQHLVGTLAVTAVRRLRRAMILLVVASWAGLSVVASAARELRDDLQGDPLEHLKGLWHAVRPVVNRLPPVLSVRAIAAAENGNVARALALEAPLVLGTLLLGSLSYAVLRGEARPRARRAGRPATDNRFRREEAPYWTLARLHLHHVLGSLQGRFGLVVPLITVLLVRGPIGAAGIGPELTLPGSVLYIALAATQFQFNQFGLDGHGAKTLFLLPIRTRDLLVGKMLALLAYSAAQNALLLVLVAAVVRPSVSDTVSAGLLAACLALAHSLEGHWVSAVYPRPLAMHRMNSTGLSGANLLPLGVGMVNGAILAGLYALLSWRAPTLRVPVLALLLGALVVAYRALLPRASRFVERHREKLIEVLG